MNTRAEQLRERLREPDVACIVGVHDAVSAQIAEEAEFSAAWASGLGISASLGMRDANEVSWSQLVDAVERIVDSCQIPILVDGDTGFGDFNNFRRLARKLQQRGAAGVCIEDKVFPKRNSFSTQRANPLANIDEFCGRIRAGRDYVSGRPFLIIARVEALCIGGLQEEALDRSAAYCDAGADAIVIHSRASDCGEVVAFRRNFGGRAPVIVIPTSYFRTPFSTFQAEGFAAVVWANQLLRAATAAMREAAAMVAREQSVANLESSLCTLSEVFRIQNVDELTAAEAKYGGAS